MAHGFDPEIAKEYSVDIAIMVNHFDYWLAHNKANKTNENEGTYWTYNSISAFMKIFPYWTKNQIRRIVKSMLDNGIIKTGNFNQNKYDRTTWYTFTEAFLQNHKCMLAFSQMEVYKKPNGSGESNEPIPDDNQVGNQLDKEESQETETMKTAKVLASLLLEKCREVDKKYCLGKEERTINGWANDIDKLIRLDKRTESEVREVIIWSKKDDFWSPNIMSGKKLRMKFPMLFAQMSKSKAQAERKRPRTREEIRAEMIARYGDK